MIEKQNRLNKFAVAGLCGALGVFIALPVYADGLDVQLEHPPQQTIHDVGSPDSHAQNAGMIIGRDLRDENGSVIGRVTTLVKGKRDHALYALVRLEGLWGREKEITIPYSQIRIMPDEILVQSQLGASDYGVMPDYQPDEYSPAKGYSAG